MPRRYGGRGAGGVRSRRVYTYEVHPNADRTAPVSLDRDDIEVWEHWTRGGRLPERYGLTVHHYGDGASSGWFLRRTSIEIRTDRDRIIRELVAAVDLLRATPPQHHDTLRRLCDAGHIDQAVELARVLS
jgi:hypothetical protein